jgi:protein SCO1/2
VGRVHARLRLALTALTLCAAAAVVGVAVADRGRDEAPLALTDGWAGAIRPAGQRVPHFALSDERGRQLTSAALRGRPTVFAFVYSTCRDTCPAQVQTIRGALDDLGHDVRVIGVSVDPDNDTPKRAESCLLKQGMTGRMDFLLGTREQLAPVWRGFAVRPQQQNLEHSAHTVLVDARGVQRIGFPYDKLTEEALAHDLARL